MSRLDCDIETDVLVIGGGILGVLTSCLLSLHPIHTVLIDSHELKMDLGSHIHHEDDTLIKEFFSLMKDQGTYESFESLIKMIYKLDDLIHHLEIPCDYSRTPICQLNSQIGIPLYNDLLSYQSGITLNLGEFHQSLVHQCDKQKVLMFDHTSIYEIDLDEVITVKTNSGSIKCRKMIFTSKEESLLFFEKDYFSISKYITLLANEIKEGSYDDSLNISIEEPSIMLPTEWYGELLPFIGKHEEYSNVYFNVDQEQGNILYGFMGALYVVDDYLCHEPYVQ